MLYTKQCKFQADHLTEHQITKVNDQIHESFEKKHCV